MSPDYGNRTDIPQTIFDYLAEKSNGRSASPARDVKVDVTDPFVNIERYERLLQLEQENEWMGAKLAAIEWLSWDCCHDCGSLIRKALDIYRGQRGAEAAPPPRGQTGAGP
jgi:hypothetical protein